MSDKNSIITERIRSLIDDSGLTRQEIAENMSCDTSLITKHYNGDRNVSVEFLIKYAELFNTTTDYILGLTATKEKNNPKLRDVCDYTGLSENAIENIVDITLNSTSKQVINDFFSSEEFKNMINALGNSIWGEWLVNYVLTAYFDQDHYDLISYSYQNPLDLALLSNSFAVKELNNYLQNHTVLSDRIYNKKVHITFDYLYDNLKTTVVSDLLEKSGSLSAAEIISQLNNQKFAIAPEFINEIRAVYEEVKNNGK